MYAMRVISSTMFRLLMFPHDGNTMTIDQLTYYDPKGPATPEQVLPTINNVSIPFLSIVGQGYFSNAPLTDTFCPYHLPLCQLIYQFFALSHLVVFRPLCNLNQKPLGIVEVHSLFT